MKIHWVIKFYDLAESKGLKCRKVRVIKDWIETINCNGKIFYTKSVTYDLSRMQYFLGVDPSKLKENGNFVLICGGKINIISDIFIIPWEIFFKTLAKGEPINTYKPPKEYFQYKFYIRDRKNRWFMFVQGGNRPTLDVSEWHYSVEEALTRLHSGQSSCGNN